MGIKRTNMTTGGPTKARKRGNPGLAGSTRASTPLVAKGDRGGNENGSLGRITNTMGKGAARGGVVAGSKRSQPKYTAKTDTPAPLKTIKRGNGGSGTPLRSK